METFKWSFGILFSRLVSCTDMVDCNSSNENGGDSDS